MAKRHCVDELSSYSFERCFYTLRDFPCDYNTLVNGEGEGEAY